VFKERHYKRRKAGDTFCFRGTGVPARHLQGRALPAVSPAQAGVQEKETGSRPPPIGVNLSLLVGLDLGAFITS
ncbi:MAG: hypothetical protein V1792_16830, partial [Pseudomonadota bacterium]